MPLVLIGIMAILTAFAAEQNCPERPPPSAELNSSF